MKTTKLCIYKKINPKYDIFVSIVVNFINPEGTIAYVIRI